jgi:hypothetical protein
MTDTDHHLSVLSGGSSAEDRVERLADGADGLASEERTSVFARDRFLLTVASASMTLGLSLIILGWIGSSRVTHVEEQVPYLISGGLLGLALAVIGAVTLFAHWLTVLIREGREREVARREDHEALLAALLALGDTTKEKDRDDRARRTRTQRQVR